MTDACIRGRTGLPLLRALEELAAEAYRGVWEFFHTAVTAREGILGTLMRLPLAVPMDVLHHLFGWSTATAYRIEGDVEDGSALHKLQYVHGKRIMQSYGLDQQPLMFFPAPYLTRGY